ncbi:MAG: methyl-accepting chemotaxis protein [Deltaproteobacteria bacterium]|jgi:methyl-accepting chemotaxis protein|nr:methyl-accepting chemotaxis protein [Deltaproteobacteria bacterium]MBW2475906.1 methyl-accepting chemotaxis protein [Deltaproteobacteria bacterium]MBW2503073.1 methyl-accepting chemotaxis protein [Deltaproteobacteria bacterium]MBW2519833.1 methyl-accepting chemotaxis protein [Deltaproteobacteria bacterium]
MRVEISHKFIIGFLAVIVSGVLVNLGVPYLQIPVEFQQLFSICCSLVVGLIIGVLFSRLFTSNIRHLTDAGMRLSRGDLSKDIILSHNAFPDETSDITDAMNEVQQSLRTLVGDIREIALRVAESSQNLSVNSKDMSISSLEVADTVDQIGKGALTQAEMVEQCNRLFKEMAKAIHQVAGSAQKVAESARQTSETAEQGGEIANANLSSLRQVLTEAEASGQQLVTFINQLKQINKIVEVINGIAQKTNLLALNATIEAARAGEYGRGFTVVAEEIRKLADSTTSAAEEIRRVIEGISEESHRVQGTLGHVIDEMERGREGVDHTSQAFIAITRNAESTQTKANDIAELTEQQIASAQRIADSIDEIDKVVSDNAAATQKVSSTTMEQSAAMEEMADSAQQLSTLSEALLSAVKQFKLAEPPES